MVCFIDKHLYVIWGSIKLQIPRFFFPDLAQLQLAALKGFLFIYILFITMFLMKIE